MPLFSHSSQTIGLNYGISGLLAQAILACAVSRWRPPCTNPRKNWYASILSSACLTPRRQSARFFCKRGLQVEHAFETRIGRQLSLAKQRENGLLQRMREQYEQCEWRSASSADAFLLSIDAGIITSAKALGANLSCAKAFDWLTVMYDILGADIGI